MPIPTDFAKDPGDKGGSADASPGRGPAGKAGTLADLPPYTLLNSWNMLAQAVLLRHLFRSVS